MGLVLVHADRASPLTATVARALDLGLQAQSPQSYYCNEKKNSRGLPLSPVGKIIPNPQSINRSVSMKYVINEVAEN